MKQLFVNVVGYPGSGKSTVIRKLTETFPELNVIDGSPIRKLLNEMVVYYQDPSAVHSGPLNQSFRRIVDLWRVELLRELLGQGQSVIVEGGIDPASRAKYQEILKTDLPEVLRIMIHCQLDESTLLKRLADRGQDAVDWYSSYAKTAIKPPELQEYDQLIVYKQDNLNEVLDELTEAVD